MRTLLLVVEVLSPSTAGNDRFLKRLRYRQAGVPMYWVVDGDERSVEVWTRSDDFPAVERDRLAWHAPGAREPFTLALEELLRPVWLPDSHSAAVSCCASRDIFSSMLPLESLFRDLNDRGGRYVVVGGLAVVLHGHLRATGDVDLLVDFATGQVDRTLSALERAGFRPYVPVAAGDFADREKRAAWVREKGMLVFSLRPASGVPMVDLFLEHPIGFEEVWARSLVVTLRGVAVRIASIADLIALKRLAGRPEDLTDIEALLAIQRLRGGSQ